FAFMAQLDGGGRPGNGPLPAEPSMLQQVILDTETPIATEQQTPAAQVSSSASSEEGWRVQVGAYRIAENVLKMERELEHLGYQPEVSRSGGLQIVTVGPFASLESAEREAARLANAKIDSVVTSERAMQSAETPSRTGAFVIQVGAFREHVNAEQLIRRIARLGRR